MTTAERVRPLATRGMCQPGGCPICRPRERLPQEPRHPEPTAEALIAGAIVVAALVIALVAR